MLPLIIWFYGSYSLLAVLFKAIVDYLLSNTSVKKSSTTNPEQLKNSFSFVRCDQTTFIETLK